MLILNKDKDKNTIIALKTFVVRMMTQNKKGKPIYRLK